MPYNQDLTRKIRTLEAKIWKSKQSQTITTTNERFPVKGGRGSANSESVPSHISKNTIVSLLNHLFRSQPKLKLFLAGHPGKNFIAHHKNFQTDCIYSLRFVFKPFK